jgi:hypothetical protein
MLSDVQDMNERHGTKRTRVVTSRLRKWGILATPETGFRLRLCGLGLLWVIRDRVEPAASPAMSAMGPDSDQIPQRVK